jgi:hypothetical protein
MVQYLIGEPGDGEFGDKSGNRPKEDRPGKATAGSAYDVHNQNVKCTCLFVKHYLLYRADQR